MTIRTAFIHPPIPRRDFDWHAWIDGHEESSLQGYGATEAEAIEDLNGRIQEDDDERV